MSTQERELLEERWVKRCSPRTIDDRLDTLRRRANYLERQITTGRDLDHIKQEHAALMWAIGELSGLGDELRRERAECDQIKAGATRRAVKRAEAAEALNIQFRVKIDALKAEVHRLSRAALQSATGAER